MDFHSLARKELQALCKKNKIPANMTNVAMADALKALEKVEGLDELNDAPRSHQQESPDKTTNPEPRTACRTSTRRKPSNVEPESSKPITRTRHVTRKKVAEEPEQENKNVNLLLTPAVPTTQRRAPASSATRKIDAQLMEIVEDEKLLGQEKCDVPETPAMRTSRRKAPAISTRKKTEDQKDEKSVQKVYGTRQSVRLLEKSMADLSLKEKRRVEAVKIEGLCEKTMEVEQKNDDVPGYDSQILSCQITDESSEHESGMQHVIQEDAKSNDQEGVGSEVLSWQNLADSLGNESGMKNEIHKHNNITDHEVDSDVLCQNIDQLLKSESETKLQLQGDEKINDHKVVDCSVKMQIVYETCTNLDNDSGLEKDDEDNNESSDASVFLEVEASEKVVDMNCESTDEKGPDVITENPESLNAALSPEIEKELNGNQDSLIVEVSGDSSVLVMETTVPDVVSVEVMGSLTSEVSEAVGKNSQINLEDEQHDINDLHSDADTEEDSDASAIKEVSDSNGSDEPENDNPEKFQENSDELSDSTGSDEPESPRFILQHENCKEASDNLANESDMIVHDQKSPFSCGLLISSPLAANRQDQSSPSTESTPTNSSSKKQTTIQKIIYANVNKENIGNFGGNIEPNEDKMMMKVADEEKNYEDISLRKLTKMLKKKLQIANKNNEGTRPALQVLNENCKAGEPENKN